MQERGRKNGRYKYDQGGLLAWKLCRQGGVVLREVDVFAPGLYSSTGIYRKEEGEGETFKQ